MDILVTKEVTKRYGSNLALNKVSISVPEQSIFGLLGPNGAGKTSLIRIINMITAPDEGTITLKGDRLRTSHQEIIGYLPEERGLYKKMKVGEQAIYLAQLKGIPKKEAVRKLKEWFERFEMTGWWNRKVEELSKGMQQKVQFVITVIHEPELLIFDEPFSGFDPINASIVRDEILRLRQNGATVIFSTHNMSSVEELCDDIALINKSNKILEGKVKDIRNQYKSNTWEISLSDFNGELGKIISPEYSIINQNKDDDLLRAVIRLNGHNSPNKLLQSLLPHGTIHSLSEILPTMNDIFIRRVNEDTERLEKEKNGNGLNQSQS
jgi:ABC-2 type transport system ATP-binding protein